MLMEKGLDDERISIKEVYNQINLSVSSPLFFPYRLCQNLR
ncbi:MAG: hypothetical protein ACOX4L_03775 [Bacillota bacterium]